MSIALVKNQLAEMKLLGMLGVLDNALAEATRDQLSGSELLNQLVQAEVDYRQLHTPAHRDQAFHGNVITDSSAT